jgi:hypothetical protein
MKYRMYVWCLSCGVLMGRLPSVLLKPIKCAKCGELSAFEITVSQWAVDEFMSERTEVRW